MKGSPALAARSRLFDSPVPWLDFMYDLDMLFDQLNRLHWDCSLPKFRCQWSSRMITTWGCCYRHRGLIRISSFFRNRPLPEAVAVLCHEMIHIRIPSHGAAFKKELRRIGMERDVEGLFPELTEITNGRRRALRYSYVCPRCHLLIQRRRKIRGYCVACYQAGITSRFRLV